MTEESGITMAHCISCGRQIVTDVTTAEDSPELFTRRRRLCIHLLKPWSDPFTICIGSGNVVMVLDTGPVSA